MALFGCGKIENPEVQLTVHIVPWTAYRNLVLSQLASVVARRDTNLLFIH
jgi:hypothetical protein